MWYENDVPSVATHGTKKKKENTFTTTTHQCGTPATGQRSGEMLKVKFDYDWPDNTTQYALQYSEKDFDKLSKVWADMGLELLVHKQEVDPLIDLIHRNEHERIVHAGTIGKDDWFVFQPGSSEFDIFTDEDFKEAFEAVEEVIDETNE